MTLGFAASDVCLLAAQAGLVAIPRRHSVKLAHIRARLGWGLLPLASIVGTVFAIRLSSGAATALTYIALAGVPPLAALALGLLARRRQMLIAAIVLPLFALAWLDRSGLIGEGAAVVLSGLSCVALAGLLVQVAPINWIKIGIVLMALADAMLVSAQLLQAPSDVLNSAAPVAGLPQLQRALFGSAVIGYGDLFIAATLGAVLAAESGPQRPAALLTFAFALCFDLMFFVVSLLPATVPVAAALVVCELGRWRRAPTGVQPVSNPARS
jgi:hypothetical protein